MSLPNLPAPGQNPWYAERDDFDDALRNRLSAKVNLREYGADPDGNVPADAAWAEMTSEVPPGTIVTLDGRFLFLDTIRFTNIHVDAYNAEVTRGDVTGTFDEELIIMAGSYGTVNMVSSMDVAPATAGTPLTTTLTLTADAADIAVGDVVRVVADDFVPASRTNTARAAWDGVVVAVDGVTVTIFGGPYAGDPFSTNIRVARVNRTGGSWRGGTLRRSAEFVNPAVGGAMVLLRDLVNPVISDVTIPLSSGAGYQLSGTYGAVLERLRTNLLRDSWNDSGTSGPVFAYHVLETNSSGTRLLDSQFKGGRHGYTTAQSTPAAGGDASSTVMRAFGIVENAIVQNVSVEGTYVSAFDTHEASRGVTFSDTWAIGSGYAGYGLRGRDHVLTGDWRAIDCNIGVRIFDDALGGESYGHRLDGGIIERPRLYAVEVDVHRFAGHPSQDQRQVGVEAFSAKGTVVRGAKTSAVKATNAIVGELDLRVIWDANPSATQSVVEAVNSEYTGGSIHSDHRAVASNPPAVAAILNGADSSIIELGRARVRGVTAQVDRIIRSGSSIGVFRLLDVTLDAQPVGSTVSTDFDGASVVDFKTLSGQTDSARAAVTAATADSDLAMLARSLRPVLTIQATITVARNLPNLPPGRIQGQLIVVFNRPNTTGGSTANLTIVQGNGPKTYLIGAANKVLTPGQSCTLQWDVTIGRWCEVV